MKKIIYLCLFAGMVAISCKNKGAIPAGLLGKQQMQAVLFDIMQAEAFTSGFIKKDNKNNPVTEDAKMQMEIFAIHHISRQDFFKSYDYYKEHNELIQPILDSITSKTVKNHSMQHLQQLKLRTHS